MKKKWRDVTKLNMETIGVEIGGMSCAKTGETGSRFVVKVWSVRGQTEK